MRRADHFGLTPRDQGGLPSRPEFVSFSLMLSFPFHLRHRRGRVRLTLKESGERGIAISPQRPRVRRGSALLEATYAITFLTALALILLKLSMNVTAPRQWSLQQTVSDAYLTYEKAWAQRAPITEVLSASSPWPEYPSKASMQVEIGKLPGGSAIYGTVYRTRIPDSNNYPVDGGSGTVTTNPSGMRAWNLQSLLVYKVGNRSYVKSRTVIRTQ